MISQDGPSVCREVANLFTPFRLALERMGKHYNRVVPQQMCVGIRSYTLDGETNFVSDECDNIKSFDNITYGTKDSPPANVLRRNSSSSLTIEGAARWVNERLRYSNETSSSSDPRRAAFREAAKSNELLMFFVNAVHAIIYTSSVSIYLVVYVLKQAGMEDYALFRAFEVLMSDASGLDLLDTTYLIVKNLRSLRPPIVLGSTATTEKGDYFINTFWRCNFDSVYCETWVTPQMSIGDGLLASIMLVLGMLFLYQRYVGFGSSVLTMLSVGGVVLLWMKLSFDLNPECLMLLPPALPVCFADRVYDYVANTLLPRNMPWDERLFEKAFTQTIIEGTERRTYVYHTFKDCVGPCTRDGPHDTCDAGGLHYKPRFDSAFTLLAYDFERLSPGWSRDDGVLSRFARAILAADVAKRYDGFFGGNSTYISERSRATAAACHQVLRIPYYLPLVGILVPAGVLISFALIFAAQAYVISIIIYQSLMVLILRLYRKSRAMIVID